MDSELFQYLPDAQKALLGKLEALLTDQGFIVLQNDLEQKKDAAEHIMLSGTDSDSYQYSRGARDALLQITELDKRIEQEFTQLAEQYRLESIEQSQESEDYEDFA